MRVLVGCECSQIVTAAFREKGHEAFSCDIEKAYGSMPEYHLQGDLIEVYSYVNPDLFICHPPCTFLSGAGAVRLYTPSGFDWVRYEKGLFARSFFFWCLSRPAKYVCIENPRPLSIFRLPVPSQIIEPYYFGEPYSKCTYLWLRGLPFLESTKYCSYHRPYISSGTSRNKGNSFYSGVSRSGGSSRVRSQTFRGIAAAMADQWSNLSNYCEFKLFDL